MRYSYEEIQQKFPIGWEVYCSVKLDLSVGVPSDTFHNFVGEITQHIFEDSENYCEKIIVKSIPPFSYEEVVLIEECTLTDKYQKILDRNENINNLLS